MVADPEAGLAEAAHSALAVAIPRKTAKTRAMAALRWSFSRMARIAHWPEAAAMVTVMVTMEGM